jgi:hypothetical protein
VTDPTRAFQGALDDAAARCLGAMAEAASLFDSGPIVPAVEINEHWARCLAKAGVDRAACRSALEALTPGAQQRVAEDGTASDDLEGVSRGELVHGIRFLRMQLQHALAQVDHWKRARYLERVCWVLGGAVLMLVAQLVAAIVRMLW